MTILSHIEHELELPYVTAKVALDDIMEYYTNDWVSALTFIMKERIWGFMATVGILFMIAFCSVLSVVIFMNDSYTSDWFNHIFMWDMKQMFSYW